MTYRTALQAKLEELDALQGKMGDKEFLKKAERELFPLLRQEMVAHGCNEPDWDPLEKVLPYAWCAGFMFMGYEGEIRIYKHGHTRRCLYIDPKGNAYRRAVAGFEQVPIGDAIEDVFEGLDAFGFTRSTPCDEKHMKIRHRIIKERTGFDIVTVAPERP